MALAYGSANGDSNRPYDRAYSRRMRAREHLTNAPIFVDQDVRLRGLCAPGEILASNVVRGMARSSAGVEFDDRGEHELKGIGEPVRVYAVR